MDFFRRQIFIVLALAGAIAARAQTPVLTQALPAQTIGLNGGPVNIDLRNYFSEPTITGQVVQFDTILGKFNVELFANDAPLNVANFLSYANSGAYTNTFVHRSVPGFVIQGGGYKAVQALDSIPRSAPVALEYKIANTRGTMAMARSDLPNTATSEWFVNLVDNTTNLAPGGVSADGYTVIGRVLGTGMTVVDAIAGLPVRNIQDNSPFTTLPLYNFNGVSADLSNLVLVRTTQVAPIYPTSTNLKAVIEFNDSNTNSAAVTAALSGSTLILTPVALGTATISVRAQDANGNFVSSTFNVTVASAATSAPVITTQPIAQTVTTGGTVAFSVAATGVPALNYQWYRSSGQPGAGTPALIPGATSATLVLSGTTGDTAALAGSYSVSVINSAGTVTSAPAALTISATGDTPRLTNLSVLTSLASRTDTFSLGYVVKGASANNVKPLVIRAAGPSLGALGFPGTLDDPKFELFAGSTKTGENEDWGGSAATANAMAAVGAFPYTSPNSRDAAVAANIATSDNSVKVTTGTNSATGTGAVIAEVYDASNTFTGTTPRLVNFSVIKPIDAGGSLTLGFTVGPPGGTIAKTVLIRVIGPGLSTVGVNSGTLGDPQLTLFNSSSVAIATNDDWGADAQLTAAGSRVGAFAITTAKDAMLIVTLPPGGYTARATGNGNSSGLAIVEVYEVP